MGSSGGGGGGSGDSTNTVRYAPYIEAHHTTFLNVSEAAGITARETNPFSTYNTVDYDNAFFGAGLTLASFPSLYSLYGTHMTGLNIDALWTTILTSTQNNTSVSALVSSQSALLNEQIEQVTLPRYQAGKRDINSVISSSFVIGQSLIEMGRNHDIAQFSAELKYKLVPIAVNRWAQTLEWHKGLVIGYSQILQMVINTQFAEDDRNFDFEVRKTLWPFTTLDYERANLGALQGAISGKGSVAGASQFQRSIGGAMSGASAGASIGGLVGGPPGGVIGAGVGGLLGLASSFF